MKGAPTILLRALRRRPSVASWLLAASACCVVLGLGASGAAAASRAHASGSRTVGTV